MQEIAGGVLRDDDTDTYYCLYHGISKTVPGYQVGMSKAKSPLGPWYKSAANPVLRKGEAGSWDAAQVASANILRANASSWVMMYEGTESFAADSKWSVGLAVGPTPEGPWTKYAGNPLMEATTVGGNGFYIASLLRVKGVFMMYAEAPINKYGEPTHNAHG